MAAGGLARVARAAFRRPSEPGVGSAGGGRCELRRGGRRARSGGTGTCRLRGQRLRRCGCQRRRTHLRGGFPSDRADRDVRTHRHADANGDGRSTNASRLFHAASDGESHADTFVADGERDPSGKRVPPRTPLRRRARPKPYRRRRGQRHRRVRRRRKVRPPLRLRPIPRGRSRVRRRRHPDPIGNSNGFPSRPHADAQQDTLFAAGNTDTHGVRHLHPPASDFHADPHAVAYSGGHADGHCDANCVCGGDGPDGHRHGGPRRGHGYPACGPRGDRVPDPEPDVDPAEPYSCPAHSYRHSSTPTGTAASSVTESATSTPTRTSTFTLGPPSSTPLGLQPSRSARRPRRRRGRRPRRGPKRRRGRSRRAVRLRRPAARRRRRNQRTRGPLHRRSLPSLPGRRPARRPPPRRRTPRRRVVHRRGRARRRRAGR